MKSYKNAEVLCGDFHWRGRAVDLDDAIIGAFSKRLPRNPSLLLRAHIEGRPWEYIDFKSALRIAGYTTVKTKHGFKIV